MIYPPPDSPSRSNGRSSRELVAIVVAMSFIAAVMVVVGLDLGPPWLKDGEAASVASPAATGDPTAPGLATPIIGMPRPVTQPASGEPFYTPPASFPEATPSDTGWVDTGGLAMPTAPIATRPVVVPTLAPPTAWQSPTSWLPPTVEAEIGPTATGSIPHSRGLATLTALAAAGTATATSTPGSAYPGPN